jgi:hypothetical protein
MSLIQAFHPLCLDGKKILIAADKDFVARLALAR